MTDEEKEVLSAMGKVRDFVRGIISERGSTTRANAYVRIDQGKQGKWRWQVYDEDGVHQFGSSVKGFDSREDAEAHIKKWTVSARYRIADAE